MKRAFILNLFVLFTGVALFGNMPDTSFTESPVVLQTSTGDIHGTLAIPKQDNQMPVALIIAGSGPTDRNGNSILTQNDALKKIAHGLADNGIASLRYDKRGIMASGKAMKKESDLRFQDYIDDAAGWIEMLKKDKRFSSVIVIGHSEGSLIGMVAAAQAGAMKYISIAGAGSPIDKVLLDQLKAGSQELYDLAVPVVDSLKQGLTVKKVDIKLFAYFRPSVQPFMMSWLKMNPQEEIKKLKIPVLIIQGTTDLQVPEAEAEKLKAANPKAELFIIPKMNHVLKIVEGDRAANAATYKDPSLPLAPGLVEKIAGFIKKKAAAP